MLNAGLDGIRNNLQPPEPVEENIYELDHESRLERKIDLLPTSLADAIEALKNDSLLRETLSEHLFERYVDVKMREWAEFKQQVTQWELETYLDIF
jgi:glutamine synthetase